MNGGEKMKRIGVSLILAIVLLAACNESDQSPQANEEVGSVGEETTENETNTQPSNESEGDEVEPEEEPEPEPEPEVEPVGEVSGNEQEERTDEVLPSAEEILQKSFEAMSDLTGVYMESVLDVREEMGETIVEETRKFNSVMLLTEPFSQRLRTVIDDPNSDESVTSEVYKVDGKHYIYRSFDDSWIWIDDPMGVRQLSPLITEDTLENHLKYSDQFEVTETEEEYLLTFSGTYDAFISSMFGGVQEMLMEIERESPPNLEDLINSFSILIEKDRFYVKQYSIYHEQIAPDDSWNYYVVKDGYVLLGNYNQYDESSTAVPDNILNEAVPAGE